MFKKNSPELKILVASIAAVFLITIIAAISFRSFEGIIFMFGIAALVVALLDIFIGVVLLVSNSRDQGKNFLVTAGMLLLISGASCGGYAVLS